MALRELVRLAVLLSPSPMDPSPELLISLSQERREQKRERESRRESSRERERERRRERIRERIR